MSKHQHYWLETGIPHLLVVLNSKFRYDCAVCSKQRFYRTQPVNPLVPSALEVYMGEVARGNAHLVGAPPVFPSDNQLAEGERYAKLVRNEL